MMGLGNIYCTIFSLLYYYTTLQDYIKALWSDDNRLLAVVNKKEGASDLEAIVYDTNRDFRVFRRETIRCEIIDDDLQCDLIDGLERFLSDMLKRAGA